MTVCIAALCETAGDSPKIVLVADRLQTSTNITFEFAPKIQRFAGKYALYSGDTAMCQMAGTVAQAMLDRNKLYSVREAAVLLAEALKLYFKQIVEEQILNSRGFTHEEFYAALDKHPEWFAKPIDEEIKRLERYEFDVCWILAGYDTTGPHLYEIRGNGGYICKDHLGFIIIGEGADVAQAELIEQGFSSTESLGNTYFKVFKAKKSAERIKSVGNLTDCSVLYCLKDESNNLVPQEFVAPEQFTKDLEDTVKQLNEQEKLTIAQVANQLDELFYRSETKNVEKQQPEKVQQQPKGR